MKYLKEQLNFNTFLILVVGAIVSFGVKKADDANTTLIQLNIRVNQLEQWRGNIENGTLRIK